MEEIDVLETFKKVQVNILLLDAIKQFPKYAKFLKELCTNKRKLKGNEVVTIGETCLIIFQKSFRQSLKIQVHSPFQSPSVRLGLVKLCLI